MYGEQFYNKMVEDIEQNCPLNTIQNEGINKMKSMASISTIQIETTKKDFKVSNWDQFFILLQRNLLQIYRNRSLLKLKIFMHILLGLLVGIMFYNMGNDASKTLFNFGFCFTVVIAFMYIPLMPILLECK